MSTINRRPDIPETLVADVDIFNLDGVQDDVQLAWRRLQQAYPDIFWTTKNGGHWIATRAADIRHIQSEHQSFSNGQTFIPATQLPSKLIPLNLDPPEHGPFRAVFAPAFTPSGLDALEQQARTIAIDLIEFLRPKGQCEFVRDFAEKLPIIVFLKMMDLPLEDREYLLGLSRQNIDPSAPEVRVEAHKLLSAYIGDHIENRKKKARVGPVESHHIGKRRRPYHTAGRGALHEHPASVWRSRHSRIANVLCNVLPRDPS
jgi:cytochrome P450